MKSTLMDHLEKLPQFLAVAKIGSIGAAARSIPIAQPALSKSIKILEEVLGKSLFIRGRKGVKLTPAGEILLQYSQDLIFSANQVQGDIE